MLHGLTTGILVFTWYQLTADHVDSFVSEQAGVFCCFTACFEYVLEWIVARFAKYSLPQPCGFRSASVVG